MHWSMDGGDYPTREERRFTIEDMGLLSKWTRKYVEELLASFPHLSDKLFIGEFGVAAARPDREPARRRNAEPEYDVMLQDVSAHGLAVYTTEGDGFCAYNIVLTDLTEAVAYPYYMEHAHEEDVLSFLKALYSEQLIAFRSYENTMEVDRGAYRLDLPRGGEGLSPACCLMSRPSYKGRELRHVTKSWNGRYNRELVAAGRFKGYPW